MSKSLYLKFSPDTQVVTHLGKPIRVILKGILDNPAAEYWSGDTFDTEEMVKQYPWVFEQPQKSKKSTNHRNKCWLNYQQYRQAILSRCKQVNHAELTRTISSVIHTAGPLSLPPAPDQEEMFIRAANGEEYYGCGGKWRVVLRNKSMIKFAENAEIDAALKKSVEECKRCEQTTK